MLKAMPVVMAVESVLASIVYACNRQWGHAAYWILAGGITTVVTFFLR